MKVRENICIEVYEVFEEVFEEGTFVYHENLFKWPAHPIYGLVI